MSLIYRTWPYSTRYRVKVTHSTPALILVVHDGEGFALIRHNVFPLPAVGSEGFITFTSGGPTGGYWQWSD